MFRLTREVRFAIDLVADQLRPVEGHNGYAGKPPITGIGQCYYSLSVTVAGEPDPETGYLLNIKTLDEAVRSQIVPLIKQSVRDGCRGGHRGGGGLLIDCHRLLAQSLAPLRLDELELHLSPFTSLGTSHALLNLQKSPMVLLHHTFEFAASHRLHCPSFSDARNREVFGKCNNPHGHGHNYVLRVSLRGRPAPDGVVMGIEELERIVDETVIERFDHRHLNLEVPEFAELNPSVENIAQAIFERLEAPLRRGEASLDAVTVWETPKTWCEYRREG